MVHGDIQFNGADFLQPPIGAVDTHGDIVKFDATVVITDCHTWFDTALMGTRQVERGEQYRVVDGTGQMGLSLPDQTRTPWRGSRRLVIRQV